MDTEQMIADCLRHTMYSWSANGSVQPTPIQSAKGVWLYGPDGQKWLDFNSQLMSVNIGHSHPRVVQAMKDAADKLIYAYPGAATEVRARVGKRLAQLAPGDIDSFFFTLGGAEANENAIKAARLFTGRFKILSRYRSYHGATNATMQLTGDPRRWPSEPGAPGFVHVMDPTPYDFSFGRTDEEIVANNLTYLEEVIQYEGPHTIAAMFIETVTGTNGILIPPKGYLKGLRALLDRYGILLVCDEVMAGMGRTGKVFAFEHGDIVPDIVTLAKGLTSSYVPLGAMGVSRRIADHFDKNVFWGGLTYNAHPFLLEVADAVLDVMIDERMIENTVAMEAVMKAEMARLQERHPCVQGSRAIGLFGMIDLQGPDGRRLAPYNGSHPAMNELAKFLKDNGLFAMTRWSHLFCNPPLCITREELLHGFEIIDRGLALVDRATSR